MRFSASYLALGLPVSPQGETPARNPTASDDLAFDLGCSTLAEAPKQPRAQCFFERS
jgi:hypothetical protein